MKNSTHENKLEEIQMLEQARQANSSQKQVFSSQLIELESVLAELPKSKEHYKIIGNIMIKKSKTELEEELKGKKDLTEIRIKSIEKEEEKLKEKMKALQNEVMTK